MIRRQTPFLSLPLVLLAAALASSGCTQPTLPELEAAAIPVRIETVESSHFVPSIDLFGEVGPSSRHPLQAPVRGRVVFRPRFGEGLLAGARVSPGEALFDLVDETVELETVEAQLQLDGARSRFDLTRKGVEGGFLPERELKEAEVSFELARARLDSATKRSARTTVRSPVAGALLVEDKITPGTEVIAGQVIAWIAGNGSARIDGYVSARDLPRLRPGLQVECRRSGDDELVAMARISEVPTAIDAGGAAVVTATVTDDLRLPATGEGLELRILLEALEDTITIPSRAVRQDGGLAYVYVLIPARERYEAERRAVQLGLRSNLRVQILDGLRVGEPIAVDGIELLSQGAPVLDAAVEERTADRKARSLEP